MNRKQTLWEYGICTLGIFITAVGIYFFKFPNQFSIGGVSGISVILTGYFHVASASTFLFVINMALLLLGFLFLGKGCGLKNVYCTILLSIFLYLLEWLFPLSGPLTDDALLELMFAVFLPSFGSALLFNIDASTGGTDIVAMIFQKYTSLNIGRALFYTDILITLGAFLFGVKIGLFSLLGLGLKTFLIDYVIESFNLNKCFNIITDRPEPISAYIVHTLRRGATIEEVRGAYSGVDKYLILTAVSRQQAVKLRRYIKSVDPHAFLMITNSSEIIGKGFRGV